ncbi:hypothetical protein F5887DRAFT_1197258 [Amanita rubescens]|nr:hypothetical protein F5887DRAFT_1197258 [Amanita rubescens]
MPLLHWSTLQPHLPSKLAAVRFAAPVHVSEIRIFPSGAHPFAHVPDIIASTEPTAFYLQVFFNAQPIHPQSNKDKQRPVNELIPSVIAYSGGLVEFSVDMGTEYATRLMIIKGDFQKLSLAVYGNVISDITPAPVYDAKPLQLPEPVPLTKAVDPANSSDPLALARTLLLLMPESPSLSLVIRLMFCLKPSNDDWDHPDFPYLHAYIDRDDTAFDLESVVQNLSRPLPEDTTIEALEAFAARVADLIGPKDSDQAYYIAKLLSISASQFPEMARILLQSLDLDMVFDANVLDEANTDRLLDAAANVDIARRFNDPAFLELLGEARDGPRTDRDTQYAINRLTSRIRGWELFEDAISNSHGNFYDSARLLKDIGTGEQSLGIWLESMTIHDVLPAKLAEIAVPPSQITPPLLLSEKTGSVRHDEFIAFVRAFVGVSSVLAVWAWSDSIGHDACREQSLAILHLWQNVSGYREIVNHLLLLRQLTRRWDGSHQTMRFRGTPPPLSFIADGERLTLRKVALVAEDGLSAALEEIAFKSDNPLSLRRLRTLRVSLVILLNSLDAEDEGEWHAVDLFWSEQKQDLNIRLIEILPLSGACEPGFNGTVIRTSEDLLRVLGKLTVAFPLNVRSLGTATIWIADVFACAGMADSQYSQSNTACVAAQEARQACIEFLRALSEPEVTAEPDKLGAEVILGTLLKHAERSSGRDPVHHVLQIHAMIEFLLPLPETETEEPSHWVTLVLPTVLMELKEFTRLLDVENRVHLLKRLIKLDQGTIGIGEWLLAEELKHALTILERLTGHLSSSSTDQRIVLQHEVYLALCVLHELITPRSDVAAWCIDAIASTDDLSRTLTQCLGALLDANVTCQPLMNIVKVLAENVGVFGEGLKRSVLLEYLRVVQLEGLYLSDAMQKILTMLKEQTSPSYTSDPLRFELARFLSSLADLHSSIDATLAGEVLAILEWLTKEDQKGVDDEDRATLLYGLAPKAFSQLCYAIESALLLNQANPSHEPQSKLLATVREKMIVKDLSEEADKVPPLIVLPETLSMSLAEVEDLLKRHHHHHHHRGGAEQESETKEEGGAATPSTPKGVKTPDLLGVVISPPTAILRSPAATGLTKTYVANDFRQLRQAPATRLNTSRLPSMHVDEFEVTASTSSPALMPSAMPDMKLNM